MIHQMPHRILKTAVTVLGFKFITSGTSGMPCLFVYEKQINTGAHDPRVMGYPKTLLNALTEDFYNTKFWEYLNTKKTDESN